LFAAPEFLSVCWKPEGPCRPGRAAHGVGGLGPALSLAGVWVAPLSRRNGGAPVRQDATSIHLCAPPGHRSIPGGDL